MCFLTNRANRYDIAIVKLSFIYIFYFSVSEDKSRTKKFGGVNQWGKWILLNRSGAKWKHLFINRNRDLIGRNQNIKTNTSLTCMEFEPIFDSSIIHRHGPERWPVARSFPSITSNKDKRFLIFFFSFLSFHQIYAIRTRCQCYQLIPFVISLSVWMIINNFELLRFVWKHWLEEMKTK